MTLQLKKLRYGNNMTQLVLLNFWIWEEKKEKERQIITRYENRRTFILIVTIDYQSFPSFHESCNCNLTRMVILTTSMSLEESLLKNASLKDLKNRSVTNKITRRWCEWFFSSKTFFGMFHSHCVTVTLTLSDTFKQFTEANIALRFRSTLRKNI